MERKTLSEYHLAKTFVARDENRLMLIREFQYLFVIGAWFDFRHVQYVVAGVSQMLNQGRVNISVTKKPQAASSGIG
jgi:hypothetical protein